MSKAKAELLPLPGPGDKVTIVTSSGFIVAGTVLNADAEKYIITTPDEKTMIVMIARIDVVLDGIVDDQGAQQGD